jgi:hypothetical protein
VVASAGTLTEPQGHQNRHWYAQSNLLSAADRACRGFLYNSFSLAGYLGSGLNVITDRRHLQAA